MDLSPDGSWPMRDDSCMEQRVPGYTRITCNPEILAGQPCVRGMRPTVQRVLEVLSQYPDWDELQGEYPELEREDISEVRHFAAERMDMRALPRPSSQAA